MPNKHVLTGACVLAASLAAAAMAAPDRPESLLPPGFDTPPPPSEPAAPAPRPATRPEPREVAAPEPDGDDGDEEPQAADGSAAEIASAGDEDDGAPAALTRNTVFSPSTSGFELAGDAPWGAIGVDFQKVLMRRLDLPLASRWAHIGLRNALLAEVAAPAGAEEQDWLAERAWLLLRMGEADAARLLLAGTDQADYSGKLAQVALQVALANSDPAMMCPVAPRLDNVEAAAAPLVEAICAALSAQPEIASDTINRARRRGEIDAIDLTLVDKLIGAGTGTGRAVTLEWEPVGRLNSWRWGLATATGLLPPENLMANAAPRVRAWTARAPMLSAEARLPYARTATGLGVFSGASLVDLYSVHYEKLPPEDIGGTDALRLRRTFVAPTEAERIAAMREFWGIGEGPLERLASKAATALAAAQIVPNERHAEDASDLIAAMMTAGYVEQAGRWAGVVEAIDEDDADPAWSQLALGLADPRQLDIGGDRVRDFVARDDSAGKKKSKILLAGLAGLGRIDEGLLQRLDDEDSLGVTRTNRAVRMLDAAASRGEGATVLLLAAAALQDRNIARIPPSYLRAIVGALVAVDQDFLARMIAAEAIARA